ncbi:hypothetical protein TNCV_16111 [Trichonephila clavipes]|nr:hypothetical protein TNCV_16111 [Trichonephila clavipes]
MSPRQIEILKSEVNKILELKIIEPGESDFTSPLILVEAQGKEARPCIDCRRLNKVTRTQFFPLPNIEELLEKVLSWISLEGIGKYPRVPERKVPYLDDIAIFSLAWDDHLKHLKDVFDRLRSAKLHIKPSKCQFSQAYVKYLGHLVGQGLRIPGELKVQVIKDFPIPTNKTQSLVNADKPQTLDHLEDNIRVVIADIRPKMLEKVIENWTSRLDYIRASRGSHMPEIIFKM